MSAEALVAILAVPPAIDACKNLISSLIGRLSHDSDKQDMRKVEAAVLEIADSIMTFSEFTEVVRKWKEIHHVTQMVLHSDLHDTIAIERRGQARFAESIMARDDVVQHEFMQLTRGQNGAFMRIDTLSALDFQVEMPEGITLSGKDWGKHIKNFATKAAAALVKKQYTTLYANLVRLDQDCVLLNVKSDAMLKQGVEDITRVMHEFRSKLNATKVPKSS